MSLQPRRSLCMDLVESMLVVFLPRFVNFDILQPASWFLYFLLEPGAIYWFIYGKNGLDVFTVISVKYEICCCIYLTVSCWIKCKEFICIIKILGYYHIFTFMIPKFPIQEDTQFCQILQESVDFFGIAENEHKYYFLVDHKTSEYLYSCVWLMSMSDQKCIFTGLLVKKYQGQQNIFCQRTFSIDMILV